MSYLVVCITAFIVAGLTLFSGFGLGTLLLPAFAVFFDAEVAVAATAVVHLANNIFKLALVGRHAHGPTVARFAVPAAAAALGGAWLLVRLAEFGGGLTYHAGGREFHATPVKGVIAALILVFAVLELWPRFDRLAFGRRWLPLGGLVSGFFGGLSGHQGALRSAFLIRAGLTKEQFIGTGVASAVIVDLSRLAVYGATFLARDWRALGGEWPLVAAAAAAAFAGSFLGARLMPRVTLTAVRRLVGVLLILAAVALGAGAI